MRLYINERLVRRNSLFGKILTWGGLAIVVGSVVISLQSPQELNPYVFGGFLGVFATQFGTILSNRWGRSPRLDEIISDGLKGLDDRFAVFHYILRADHALFTPNGNFALIPRTEEGVIEFRDGKWVQQREKRGFLRRGGSREITGLDRQALSVAAKLQRRLRKSFPEEALPDVQPVLVFLHSEANVQVQDSLLPAVHVKKLKGGLRRLPKSKGITREQIDDLARSSGF